MGAKGAGSLAEAPRRNRAWRRSRALCPSSLFSSCALVFLGVCVLPALARVRQCALRFSLLPWRSRSIPFSSSVFQSHALLLLPLPLPFTLGEVVAVVCSGLSDCVVVCACLFVFGRHLSI